jgi:hypothetical protein
MAGGSCSGKQGPARSVCMSGNVEEFGYQRITFRSLRRLQACCINPDNVSHASSLSGSLLISAHSCAFICVCMFSVFGISSVRNQLRILLNVIHVQCERIKSRLLFTCNKFCYKYSANLFKILSTKHAYNLILSSKIGVKYYHWR